ncbi:hypothetical protein P7D22_09590 [Lichenihabitans sp. Uapishka_5]|uniref:hypothetical protein n=1 Tax=Lichenihabitans sp. Uapishka_5 TaxID=3037302 RepID=UPI0029E822E3|nr:hypothetical protein [Lichenihabitans sp. Uapishka_5]MDX7951421.1 hypothetical protein [Lichenihabitans sp. Uapishka_5]
MRPRFRFVDAAMPPEGDAQFWRDADASTRLNSRFKANLFLRELCHSRAWDGMAPTPENQPICAARERALLEAALARGYGLFGPDLDRQAVAPISHTG